MIEFKDNKKADINLTYKPADNLASDRRRVYERFSLMKMGRVDKWGGDLEAKWRKALKQYEAWRPNKSADDWQSNIVPPFTTTIVEKALAEIVDQTIQPTITARGTEDLPKAKLMNYIKEYTWEVADGDLELYSAIKQALILGKTIWQEDFWQDKREVKYLKKFDLEKNEEEYVKKDIYDYNDVYGESVSLFDFYIDPIARTINRGKYKADDCIRRYIMSYNAFMESFKGTIFDQFGATKYVRAGKGTDYYQYYQPGNSTNQGEQVEVLWYWGRRPDKLIIVANDVVIRDGPNPFRHKQLPFAEGSDVPSLYSFYGMGEPHLLESIQDELTTLRRMRIDRQHLDIWKMFLVNNREDLDEDEAIVAPSRFIHVDDPVNGIRALDYDDINPSAYMEEDRLKQDGREVTGVTSPQPSSTATDAAIQKESTMRALRMKIWLLSRELLTGIIRLRTPNIVQYYSTPRVEGIVGEDKMTLFREIRTKDVQLELGRDGMLVEKDDKGDHFFEVKPDMIEPYYGGYDLKFSAEPSLPVSKPLLQQKFNELSNNPIVMLAIQNGYYDPGKIADKGFEVNDYDPEQFKANADANPQNKIDQTQLLELANRENEQIAKGVAVPSTPYASRQHTNIHLAYMDSKAFTGIPQDKFMTVLQNMMAHIQGEGAAQDMRSQGGGQMPTPGQPAQSVGQGVMGSESKAAMPNMAIGAENVPPISG